MNNLNEDIIKNNLKKSDALQSKLVLSHMPIMVYKPYVYKYGWEIGSYLSELVDHYRRWVDHKKMDSKQAGDIPRISIKSRLDSFYLNEGEHQEILEKMAELKIMKFLIQNECIYFQLNGEELDKCNKEFSDYVENKHNSEEGIK